MNGTFNIKRFGKWFVSDLKACISNYGLSFMLISMMGLIIYAGTTITGLLINGTWGGPGIIFRTITFAICMAVMILTLPPKCYGHITDKRAGATWLMIPASSFEKFLSMVTISAILLPALFTGIYLGLDTLLCTLDSTCGDTVMSIVPRMFSDIPEVPAEVSSFIGIMTNPLTYIDDIIGTMLVFLLGAICFKSAKTVKTILCLMALSTILSMIMTPFMSSYMQEMITNPSISVEEIFGSRLFRNLPLIDTISDISTIVIASAAIFFRIKTLKH